MTSARLFVPSGIPDQDTGIERVGTYSSFSVPNFPKRFSIVLFVMPGLVRWSMFLWEELINVFSMEKTNQFHLVFFHKKPQSIFPDANAIIGSISLHFLAIKSDLYFPKSPGIFKTRDKNLYFLQNKIIYFVEILKYLLFENYFHTFLVLQYALNWSNEVTSEESEVSRIFPKRLSSISSYRLNIKDINSHEFTSFFPRLTSFMTTLICCKL